MHRHVEVHEFAGNDFLSAEMSKDFNETVPKGSDLAARWSSACGGQTMSLMRRRAVENSVKKSRAAKLGATLSPGTCVVRWRRRPSGDVNSVACFWYRHASFRQLRSQQGFK
jgi:hypothetical protein